MSPNSASYHAARRQGDQLRHSPSRGGPPPTQNYYADADEDEYHDDELIDNVEYRYADYHPTQPSQNPNWVAMRNKQNGDFHTSEMV